jgi:hypothetical protein
MQKDGAEVREHTLLCPSKNLVSLPHAVSILAERAGKHRPISRLSTDARLGRD